MVIGAWWLVHGIARQGGGKTMVGLRRPWRCQPAPFTAGRGGQQRSRGSYPPAGRCRGTGNREYDPGWRPQAPYQV